MSWDFTVALLLAVIAGVTLLYRKFFSTPTVTRAKSYDSYGRVQEEREVNRPSHGILKNTAFFVLGLAALFLIWSTFVIVGTKNVGIVLSFNRPIGTMDNGVHLKLPWQSVEEWDGRLQTLVFSDVDDPNVDESGKGLSVRLGNQSTATIDLTFQYRFTDSEGTMQLFRDYKDEESVKKNLAKRVLQDALNRSFGDFDPITALAQLGDRGPATGMDQLSEEAKGFVRQNLPPGIEVVTLTVIMPHYDGATEDRIKAFNTAIQDTAIAKQREETAAAIKRANDILLQSNASPAVIQQNCIDMVERVVKSGGHLPEAFSCLNGGSVVIPATATK